MRQAVRADLGEYTPKRIGHFDLIKKYQHHFGFEHHLDKRNAQLSERYITYAFKVVQGSFELDYNKCIQVVLFKG